MTGIGLIVAVLLLRPILRDVVKQLAGAPSRRNAPAPFYFGEVEPLRARPVVSMSDLAPGHPEADAT